MINPFQEFKDRSGQPEKHIPLDEILASHLQSAAALWGDLGPARVKSSPRRPDR